jgi:pimeloyl-ACP methyl ester carboxylesterase
MLVQSHDGTLIACETGGNGRGLLLVHGTGTSGGRWRPVRSALEARFTVHAMDRRGHGRSGDAPDYAIEQEYDDIACCIAAVAARPIDVVAHSYGALCALGAGRGGARIGRLVLYEPPVPAVHGDYYPAGVIPAMRAAIARGDTTGAMTEFLVGVHGMRAEDVVRMQRLGAWREQTAMAPLVLRELEAVDRFRFVAAEYAGWRIPTLLLLGGDSPAQYRATAEMLGGGLPGSRIEVLPGQGHNAINAGGALFADAVLRFLGA